MRRLAPLAFVVAIAAACGGDDDPQGQSMLPDAEPGAIGQTTPCGSGLHTEMCDGAAEICVVATGGGFTCEPLPTGCGGSNDADRTCAACGEACGAATCADDDARNSITCG